MQSELTIRTDRLQAQLVGMRFEFDLIACAKVAALAQTARCVTQSDGRNRLRIGNR